ncbi:MAG TPA: Uma2 family endonuclease [Thermoanaerobaculia bacterium]|nr:Uma2 family endonuclease [Thermoanaerobaculia bacterium]
MSPAVVIEEQQLRIPSGLDSLAAFRAWATSGDFPERGRIDYLAGEVEVEMSPEDLHAHGAVKTAIAAALHEWMTAGDRGEVFIDRARVSAPAAALSVEPDVVLVTWESLDRGRCRYVPARDSEPGRSLEIEGAPDLVVEIVSRGSRVKDTQRLPVLYARAGVPELWLVDALGAELHFEVRTLPGGGRGDGEIEPGAGAYRVLVPDADGWVESPRLGCQVRLTRERTSRGTWRYRLARR